MTLVADVDLTLGNFRLDVELIVDAEEPVAILGPNAAGKTTLLRTLAGLLAVDHGRVALAGTVLDDPAAGVFVDPERRRIGVVFQEYALFPHLSALDNVAFGLRGRMPRSEARRRASAWLDRVGLAGQRHARPAELSGGQAQRVALARALAREPALLLLDEPLAALDAQTRAEIRRDLRRHLAGFDGVRLVVTHDPLDALTLAERLVIVEAGRITQAGTPDEVTARPRTAYAADLAGTNLYRGNADRDVVRLDGGTILATATGTQGPVYAVVSPSAVALHREQPHGSPRNAWPGRIATIERLGGRARVRVEGSVVIVADVTVAAAAALGLHEGDEVWAAVKATEVEVYPA